jgi:hypothetical protein
LNGKHLQAWEANAATDGKTAAQVRGGNGPISTCPSFRLPRMAKANAAGRLKQGTAHMNKRQIIEDIRRFNITVPGQFLAQFDEEALTQYLEHLEFARKKHLRSTPWTRGQQAQLRLVS